MKSFDHQVFGEMHQPTIALNEEGTLHKEETKDSPHRPCNVESVINHEEDDDLEC